MTDLERLFHQLVAALAAGDPGRLSRPVSLREIRESLLPYRTSRRALGIDTVEDYDLLLLRLAAGEGGFARITPDDARTRFVVESASSNPDLSVLTRHADALVSLEGLRVARALGARQEDRYAPPEAEPEPDADAEVLDLDVATAPAPGGESSHLAALMCLYCGATLPTGRTVNFCPSCGQSQTTPRCPQCQVEVELGWRHCITCGASLAQV